MWQEQAKALFFMEKKSIKEISRLLLKSEKTIQNYFKKLPEYQQEKEKRKKGERGKGKRKGRAQSWRCEFKRAAYRIWGSSGGRG